MSSSPQSINVITELSGPQKAAAFLMVLGKEAAVKVGEYFTKEELRIIVAAAEELPSVNTNTVDTLVQEFDENYLSIGLLAEPDELSSVFGTSDNGIAKGKKADSEKAASDPATLITNLDDDMVLEFFQNEPPMISALLLDALGQEKAAAILNKLDPELRNQVFTSYMNRKELSPAMESMLAADLLELVQAAEADDSAAEAVEKAASMINFLPENISDDLVEFIKEQDPGLANSITKALFRFPMIEFLDKPTRAKIMDGVDSSDVAKALIDVSEGLKDAVLDVMSQRNRRMIESELALGAKEDAIDIARKAIASHVLKLVKAGKITLPTEDEELAA